jgi:hypothetical protein
MARLASSSLATSAPPISDSGTSGRAQVGFEIAARFLAGADDDVVDRQALRLAIDDDMQAGVVDALVAHPGKHLHATLLEQGATNPAGGPGEAVADLGRLALQQPDLARRRLGQRRPEAAAPGEFGIDPPFVLKALDFVAIVVGMGQELRNVEADPAGTDDRHPFAGNAIAFDQVGVGDHLLVRDAR